MCPYFFQAYFFVEILPFLDTFHLQKANKKKKKEIVLGQAELSLMNNYTLQCNNTEKFENEASMCFNLTDN